MKSLFRTGVIAAVLLAVLGTFTIQSPISADGESKVKVREPCSENSTCKSTDCFDCLPGHWCQDCTELDPCSEPQCAAVD